jgi:dihydrolipoamide dehydrogenase
MADADLLVVGGGPAGISAALRARELGARVILFERERVGGACLHRGCVPTVDSLELANRRRATQEGPAWGLETSPGTVEMAVARRHRDRVVERLYRGTRAYLEQVGVQLVEGEACLLPGCAVEATIDGRTEKFTGRGVVLAVGAAFALPEVPGVNLAGVWTTDHCLGLDEVPVELVVYGGGFIGVEWAQFYQALGSRVTLLEPGSQLLPGEDPELGEALEFLLAKDGIEVRTGWELARIEAASEGLVIVSRGGQAVATRRFLISDCRRPRTQGLEELGVALQDGAVRTDNRQATTVAGVFAAGDITGGRMLSDFARAQGMVAAENALGFDRRFDPRLIPRVYHTRPEVGAVGLTEAEARSAGLDVVIGRADLGFNARALTLGQELGFAKVVAARPHGRLVGVHILGPLATEAISAATVALKLEALVEDLADLEFGHPTVAEAVTEAAKDALRQLR